MSHSPSEYENATEEIIGLNKVSVDIRPIVLQAIQRHCADRNLPVSNISIQDRSVGINCAVFLITIQSHSRHQSRFVFKSFGEIFHMPEPVAKEVQMRLIHYQDQLNQHGVLFPFMQHKGDFRLHEMLNGWVVVTEEQYFGEGLNHLDELKSDDANKQETMILTDIEAIISLKSANTATILGNECTLLRTGFDAKPDNFVTHGQSSIYIDLYPPLPLENGILWTHSTLLHPTHPISKEGWFFFVATFEGAILRYLNSGEFKLGLKGGNIRRHYESVLNFIEPIVSTKTYEMIFSQIREKNFSIVNDIYRMS